MASTVERARNGWKLPAIAIAVGYVLFIGFTEGIGAAAETLGKLTAYGLIVAVILSLPAWFRLLRQVVTKIVKYCLKGGNDGAS